MKEYELIIIGGGPGGYIAAERAGALGRSVILFEKDELGGVCLNRGCIPTKTLLHASKLYAHAKEGAKFGVIAHDVGFDLSAAMSHKQKTVEALRRGIAAQMKRNNVTVAKAEARIAGRRDGGGYLVEAAGEQFTSSRIIVATGSSPVVPPIPGMNGPQVVDSTGLLAIDKLPKRLVIIGGGYIGMEFASFFGTIGTEVTVVEMMDEIVPVMDRDFASVLRKAIPGVTYELGAKVLRVDGGTVVYSRNGTEASVQGDLVLVSVGRRPNVEGIGLRELGIDIDRSGVRVDDHLQTNLPGIYAVGDVTGKSLLAHAASRMGEVAVRHIFSPGDTPDRMRYHAIPWVVFTAPEVAGCGLTEQQAAAQGRNVKIGQLPFSVSGRYLAENPGERGVCKVVTDAENGVILGVHMIGSGSSELIFGAAIMIENELRVRDVREIVFPHPTVSEVMRDTIWAIE